MKPASLSNLKKELTTYHPDKLIEFCIRLAKYKVENKELLNYLIHLSEDEELFLTEVKNEIDEQFDNLNKSSLFLAKKTIRKALRTSKKYIRFSGNKTSEIEILAHFCFKLRRSGLTLRYGTVIGNLYMRQIERINKVFDMLHEDLKLDYEDLLQRID
jgi:uncharacterized FlaG/YvyC family protein